MSDTATAIRATEDKPDFATGSVNLASPRLGANIIEVSDDFFGAAERMLNDAPPIFFPDRYDEHGKWMDGWESRRRRQGGHDHCIVQLGAKGVLSGFEVNTRFFTGNHPPFVSIEGALIDGLPDENTVWTEIVAKSDLQPDTQNLFPVDDDRPYNILRINILPDGGVARFRVWGTPVCEWKRQDPAGHHELSAIVNAGRVVGYSDAHYGAPWIILTPGRGQNMGDGWETRRRRGPGNDWIVIALGAAGHARKIEIDTAHFKGNYPDRCTIQAGRMEDATDADVVAASEDWPVLLDEQKLQMDHIHDFEGAAISDIGAITHIRLNIFPDGGVSRVRIFGPLAQED
ncbi:MAG: allantoicase [Rhodospirillaceae bacterium]|nr:allantoicase [Rhodospirillaceae bacterium]